MVGHDRNRGRHCSGNKRDSDALKNGIGQDYAGAHDYRRGSEQHGAEANSSRIDNT